nr:MAG TPA: hypothetical protein [Bacteriophage sp.]
MHDNPSGVLDMSGQNRHGAMAVNLSHVGKYLSIYY